MIWTYTEAAKVASDHLNKIVFDTVRDHQAKALNQIPRRVSFEGDRHGVQREDGSEDQRPYMESNAVGQVMLYDDRPPTLKEAEDSFRKMALDFAKDISVKFFKTLDDQLTKAGRLAHQGPITPDSIIKVLDDLWIEFDGNGRPKWPELHAAKEVGEKFSAAWTELITTPQHLKRLEQVLLRKRNEWSDRETRKYLAD